MTELIFMQIGERRVWSSQLWGGQRSRSCEARDTFGGQAEASLPTCLGQV